jgi:hypothetical protein
MPSIGDALINSLCSVERPGDFCVGGLREIFMPTIDVDAVGRIAFPLLPVQVERLVAIAEAAPYGRGEETVIDRGVRRTWQIDSGKVRIGGRHWQKTLAELVADVALGLGVSEPVAADSISFWSMMPAASSSATETRRRSPACSRRWCSCCPQLIAAAN